MTENITHSRPYAEAAYKIATEEKSTNEWKSNLLILSEVLKDGQVKAIIASPKITDKKTLDFLLEFLPSHGVLFKNFLITLIENKKIYFIDQVSSLFNDMLLNKENIIMAEIETAYELEDKQKTMLSKMLEVQFWKQIKIQEEINKDLLAGIKIKVNNQVIDYSVKSKIDSMREKITTRR